MQSMSTLTIMIAITLFMQAILIAFSSKVIKSYKGVIYAAIATVLLSSGFLVLTVLRRPGPIQGYLSNLLRIFGYSLYYIAICKFTNTEIKKFLLMIFMPLSLLLLTLSAVFHFIWIKMIAINLLTGIVFIGSTIFVLFRSEHSKFRLSMWFTSIPLMLYVFVLIFRLVAGILFQQEFLPMPSLSGKTTNISIFIFSFFWTAGFILMISQRLQADLIDLAMNDALTRIKNRRAMKEMLDFEMDRVLHEIRDFSIILADIDHFKKVNDTYGHDAGDLVLQWFASTIQQQLRIQDVVARWGGEEFLILLPDTSLEEAKIIGERLRIAIETGEIKIIEDTLKVTFSGGISSSKTNRDVTKLCKVADKALYIAKETRNRLISQDELNI